MRSGEGLTSFSKDNRVNFSGGKKEKWSFGVSSFRPNLALESKGLSNAERVGVVNPGMVIYLCHLGWEKTATGSY